MIAPHQVQQKKKKNRKRENNQLHWLAGGVQSVHTYFPRPKHIISPTLSHHLSFSNICLFFIAPVCSSALSGEPERKKITNFNFINWIMHTDGDDDDDNAQIDTDSGWNWLRWHVRWWMWVWWVVFQKLAGAWIICSSIGMRVGFMWLILLLWKQYLLWFIGCFVFDIYIIHKHAQQHNAVTLPLQTLVKIISQMLFFNNTFKVFCFNMKVYNVNMLIIRNTYYNQNLKAFDSVPRFTECL